MFRDDEALRGPAAAIAAMARDVSEFMGELGLRAPVISTGQRVGVSWGLFVAAWPANSAGAEGFVGARPGSASSIYRTGICAAGRPALTIFLQPGIATRLRDLKVANIGRAAPDFIAAGNIGCITQIASGTGLPVVHTVELLDWATGGPRPPALAG